MLLLNKAREWNWLDRITCDSSQMHMSESIYYTMKSCVTTHKLWEMLLSMYEKKTIVTKINLIRCVYNLWMKESDSVTAHLSAYETIIAQLSSQGMTIKEELCALMLMSSLPPSCETFVTTI